MKARADEAGITLPPRTRGSYDVLFDGEAVWSLNLDDDRGSRPVHVPWPRAMRPWLHGRADLALRRSVPEEDDEEPETIPLGSVTFGEGEERIRFVDSRGLPVVIDKWGIVQRPFSSRGESVTAELAELTGQVIDVVREDCGIDAWIAFGTLLGAARNGRAIGHDSDSDLLYLSNKATPAEINLEAYEIKRALARRGFKTVLKTGSFVTVLAPGSDGAPIGIDVYACFYVDDVLHETATLRAPIPPEAILPLTTMEFEGRRLAAPADPERLLAASYGPGWRRPDPSFRHQPDAGTVERFDGWFGSMMTNRRAWEAWWREHPGLGPASPLAERVLDDHGRPVGVFEIGAGNGSDAVRLAEAGHRVHGVDYARRSFRAAQDHGRKHDLTLTLNHANLYDVRDALTLGALQLHKPHPPRVVLARSVLDALLPRGRDAFWRLLATTLRGGGRAYLQFVAPDQAAGRGDDGPPLHPVPVEVVRRRVQRLGGRVLLEEQVTDSGPWRPGECWHVVAEWA